MAGAAQPRSEASDIDAKIVFTRFRDLFKWPKSETSDFGELRVKRRTSNNAAPALGLHSTILLMFSPAEAMFSPIHKGTQPSRRAVSLHEKGIP
jgi:hypothetical protein